MKIAQMIAQLRAAVNKKLEERAAKKKELDELRDSVEADGRDGLNETEEKRAGELIEAIRGIDAELDTQRARLKELEEEQTRDEAADRLQRDVNPTGAGSPGSKEREQRIEVNERRTYSRDSDRNGKKFLQDIAAQFVHGSSATEANERLASHMREEVSEREANGQVIDRAVGTAAFSGLVIPQYLTDLYAPKARAGRPFADACRSHDLPETGMTVYIGRVTTGTSVDDQAAEHDTVDETDIDDTLLSVPVRTAAGSQTISRQGLERGVGVEDTTMEDLFAAYATNLDSKLLNTATVGLAAVATAITYTDADPTAAELYPKLVAGPAAVEAALLNQHRNDNLAVMHSRRWYWLQSQLTSQWPMFGTQGVPAANGGIDFGEAYGSGFRGVLPTGTVVVVDNNVVTNVGAGTNEDEVYFGAQSELHLWEDPDAPMLIRAEQSQVKKLDVDFVAYGYYAFTFQRMPHVQKVGGTGLVTPSF